MLELVDRLLSEPSSRYRARVLKETPELTEASKEFGFLGWSQTETILLTLRNDLVMLLGGKAAKSALLDAPQPERQHLFAPTIADFNEGAFFALMHKPRR